MAKDRKKIIKSKFRKGLIPEDLLDEINNDIDSKYKITKKPEQDVLKIPSHILKIIVENLSKFEKGKDFLKTNITLSKVASNFKTNNKYLSKTINQHKQKTFTQYINDLRIDYLIKKLKTDNSYTKYSIKAIAEEIGFKTPNAFSRAFFKKVGKYPSKYIKELKN